VAPENNGLHEHGQTVDRDETGELARPRRADERLVRTVAVDEAPLHTGKDPRRDNPDERNTHRQRGNTLVVPHQRAQDHDKDRRPEERDLWRDREPVDRRVRNGCHGDADHFDASGSVAGDASDGGSGTCGAL